MTSTAPTNEAVGSILVYPVYNSTVFLTTAAYQYDVYVGNAPFSNYDAQTVRFPRMNVTSDMDIIETSPSFEMLQNSEIDGRFQRLDNSECISTYATNFPIAHSNVLVITDDNITSHDFDLISFQSVDAGGSDPYYWICSGLPSSSNPCSSAISNIRSRADEWVVAGTNGLTGVASNYRVKYCLSEEAVEKCKVEYHLPLAIVVIIFNVVKATILCIIALSMGHSPILTTGDAVAGFMRRPDRFTSVKMPLSRKEVKGVVQSPWMFSTARRPWGSAVPVLRTTICLCLYTASVSLCIGLLVYAFSDVGYNTAILWTSDLGAAVQQFLIHGNRAPTSLTPNILIANLPQAIFSLIYFCTNSVFTTMALAVEWSSYAIRRKGLRVSTSPRGAQRSSYFLSLPYRYAIPFMALSTLLHWLISQSLFLVSVEVYDSDFNRRSERDIMTCGYSPVGAVSGLSVSGFVVLSLIGIMGFKKFKSGMPVAGSCSLAIAAACHPYASAEEEAMEHPGIEYLPLQWGVVSGRFGTAEHCSFSSEEVGLPEDGHICYWLRGWKKRL
ncbi:hypothetical protein HFD88_005526 [Aspergillus terreus]|nr:hypothetical protein HFD88_005526 [Aspergillus terreus]